MTHQMKLRAKPFEQMKSGKKVFELRLFDEKRRKLQAGDRIEFTNLETNEALIVRVLGLHVFESFEELFNSLPLEKCGFNIDDDPTAIMETYYSQEQQAQHGVVCIEVERLEANYEYR